MKGIEPNMLLIESFLSFFGRPVIALFELMDALGKYFIFQIKLFKLFFKPPYRSKEILTHMEIVGIGSIGVISLTGIFTGMVSAVQLYQGFHNFGAESMMGYTIFISISRELGPVFAGLMVASRAISAMAAELGTMRVTEQIDALDVLAIDSKKYLLIPRIIATTISLPLLVALFDFLGNISAYLISTKVLGVNPTEYMSTINLYLHYSEIFTGIAKGAVFGLVISSIGTYIGYTTKGGAKGVGEATTKAVVASAVMIFVLDYFMSALFLLLGW